MGLGTAHADPATQNLPDWKTSSVHKLLRRRPTPGRRVYAKSDNLPTVLGGLGVAIISTSQGLLTDRQATEKGVGGEVLAYVW